MSETRKQQSKSRTKLRGLCVSGVLLVVAVFLMTLVMRSFAESRHWLLWQVNKHETCVFIAGGKLYLGSGINCHTNKTQPKPLPKMPPYPPCFSSGMSHIAVDLGLLSLISGVLGLVVFAWTIPDKRSRPDRCAQCDYNLTGNTTGRCPECGQVA